MAVTTEQAAITALQALVDALSGMREAPAYAPEMPTVFPCAICMLGEGDIRAMDSTYHEDIATLYLDLHYARRDLKYDLKQLTPWLTTINNMLAKNPTISDTVDTIVFPVHWRQMLYRWDREGLLVSIGLRFEITVKLHIATT